MSNPYMKEAEEIRKAIDTFAVNQTDETLIDNKAAFELWRAGINAEKGKIYRYGEDIYKCIQPHPTQDDWTPDTIQSVSANQLLMAIELGTFDTQGAIGRGVVSNDGSGYMNCASLTGSTSSLGDTTGMADETIYDVAGTGTPFNTNGKVSVSYRGMENPWGNIWKHVNGINIWGNGSMKGGQAYICSNYSKFNESDHGENYEPVGFTISNISTWVSAFGYGSEKYDWLFLPSETGTNNANSGAPVGDHFSCISNLKGYRSAIFGGRWGNNLLLGGFYWDLGSGNGNNYYSGGRLLFVPTVTA